MRGWRVVGVLVPEGVMLHYGCEREKGLRSGTCVRGRGGSVADGSPCVVFDAAIVFKFNFRLLSPIFCIR